MTYKKILLKDASDVPVDSLTVGGDPLCCALPENARCAVCLAGDTLLFPEDRVFLIPTDTKEISVLGTAAGKEVFASTLKGEARRIAKWRLVAAAESQKVPTPSLKQEEQKTPVLAEDEPQTEGRNEQIVPKPDSPVVEVLNDAESEVAKAERLISAGTPFPLFEKLMPSSRWALVEEEDASYLVGVKEEGGEKRVLYGVPGSQGFPPDEEELWSFFPIDEDGETGYFLTEAKKAEV